jgi:hypothetical protein
MSDKLVLPFVEIMVTQACNLSCVGCTNYSDIAHKGFLTWNKGQDQIIPWLDRVLIPDFGIIGGEPLLNNDIRQWIIGIRKLMPNTQIRFTTNGLLLGKNFDILDLCYDIGNMVFKITRHVTDKKLDNLIEKIFNKFNWDPIIEYGINRWRTDNNLRLQINTPTTFIKTFVGDYKSMRPHHSDPTEAFNICCQQTCPLIYQGKLYKCSTTALLEDTLARFNYPNKEDWEKYLQNGLNVDCTDIELTAFIKNFGKPHSMCAQCPAEKDVNSHLIHFDNVSFKKYA